jgi:hypothetical protein
MRTTTLTMVVLLVVGCAGCGLNDPYNRPSATTVAHAAAAKPATTGATLIAPPVDQPSEGPEGSAQRTLYEFARTYGNFSSRAITAHRHELETLATPRLARTIDRESVSRGNPGAIPAGASLSSEIVNLDLAPSRADHRQAVVVLEQHLTLPSRRAEQPIVGLFVAEVVMTSAGWRVAEFRPQR